MPKDLEETLVVPDTYRVSPQPMLMVAELRGALALCLHDEGRGVGGLLHLRLPGHAGRSSDITDSLLSSVLAELDRFKRAVIGDTRRMDDIQARILAHAPPPTESGATLVDLIRADLGDTRIACGAQTVRRSEPIRVCFEPCAGRVWLSGPSDVRAVSKARRSAVPGVSR